MAVTYCYHIQCQGPVQGQGVRPKVACMAQELGVCGCVYNDRQGIGIQIQASEHQLQRLQYWLRQRFPQAQVHVADLPQARYLPEFRAAVAQQRFVIVASQDAGRGLHLPLDMGICRQCEAEIKNSDHHRYHYLLNACVECGPRYSCLKATPFDRSATSLSGFALCERCRQEYRDSNNRRFHGQLINCEGCGPQYWLEDSQGNWVTDAPDKLIALLAARITQGGVVAIKGVGGYHLCCDASHPGAVARIRQIKARPHKPLAIMGTINQLAHWAELSVSTRKLLQTNARPVVIAPKIKSKTLQGIAPGSGTLGIMLPYTALQVLLLEKLQCPLVMTSANLSGEPLIYRHQDFATMQSQVDLVATHNRDILHAIDDAVLQGFEQDALKGEQVIRLGRGIAPKVINLQRIPVLQQSKLTAKLPAVLAMGGELKNSMALFREGELLLSPYVGDLHSAAVYQRYQQTILQFLTTLDFSPSLVAVDGHPDYHSTQWGLQIAKEKGLPVATVQHHHAHAVACRVEHQLVEDSFAIVMDGFGWGDDQSLWGGEILLVNHQHYQRLGHLKPFSVVGGGLAARQPWRNAVALMQGISKNDCIKLKEKLVTTDKNQGIIEKTMALLNSQTQFLQTSSVGRLFDGVAALLGFPYSDISYEGQAAMWLQYLAQQAIDQYKDQPDSAPIMTSQGQVIDPQEFIEYLLSSEDSTAMMAYQFHRWLAEAFTNSLAQQQLKHPHINSVVLSGGVMQNAVLLNLLVERLRMQGLIVYWPQRLPANDGAIAVGQVAVALAQNSGTVS